MVLANQMPNENEKLKSHAEDWALHVQLKSAFAANYFLLLR
jgi:hypothetical protein